MPIVKKPQRIVTLGKEDQDMVTIIKKGTSREVIKKLIDEVVSKSPKKDIIKYAGQLKTEIDPLAYQRQMRNEWE